MCWVLGCYVRLLFLFFFFKQKTAYEMRISDWSSDVCSSDLLHHVLKLLRGRPPLGVDVVRQSRLKQHLDNFAEDVAFADGVIVETKIGRASCRERVCQYV